MQKVQHPITPKSINALQRLLQQNTPINVKQIINDNSSKINNNHQSHQSGQIYQNQSGSQPKLRSGMKMRNTKKLKEMINQQNSQENGQMAFAPSSDRNGSYKQRRPPELQEEEPEQQNSNRKSPQVLTYMNKLAQSARVKGKSLQYGGARREPQTTTNVKSAPQHFIFNNDIMMRTKGVYLESQTTTNAKAVGPGGGGSGFNMFGSLNEVLKQYIQAKSSHDKLIHENVAGTGEGVRISDPQKCYSARNGNQKKSLQVQSDQKKDPKHTTPRNKAAIPIAEHLEKLYLKTSKMLNGFKAKEALWSQEKRDLKDEVLLLKNLLKSHKQY